MRKEIERIEKKFNISINYMTIERGNNLPYAVKISFKTDNIHTFLCYASHMDSVYLDEVIEETLNG